MSDSETKWEGKFLKVVEKQGWQFVKRQNISGIVCIVPLTSDGKVVLIEQHRIPLGQRVIEFPAGLVGDEAGKEDEEMSTAAVRELMEETGYQPERLEYLFEGAVSAGLTDERITFYLAPGCTKIGRGGGDGSEDITTFEVPLDEALEWIRCRLSDEVTVDVKTMAVLSFWLRSVPTKG